MADRVDVFNPAVRKKNSKLQVVIRLFTDCSFYGSLPAGSIFRMGALQAFFPVWHALFRIELIDAIPFLGEIQRISSQHFPDPTPGVREALRFGKIAFASP